jgi:hypothetical protein
MTGWLTNRLASLLSPAEREAVLGDATENGTVALSDLVSVLVWREARAWTMLPPWIALVTLVLPLGFVLTVIARDWAGWFAIMFWIYANNWTREYLTNPGARMDLLFDFAGRTSLQTVCLVLWSWIAGRALRTLSGRAVGSNAVVLTVIVLAGTVGTTTMGMLNPANAMVFSSALYRVAVPLIVRVVIVLVPFWYAVLSNDNAGWWWTVGRSVATALLIGATFRWITQAMVFGWIPDSMNTARSGSFALGHGPEAWSFWWVAQLHWWSMVLRLLVPFALAWPAAYLMIQERRRQLAM